MAGGHVNRANRPNTWLHRPMLHTFKKVLANSEPSTHGGKADIAEIRSGLDSHLGQNRRFFSGNVCDPLRAASSCMPSASHSNSAGSKRTAWSRCKQRWLRAPATSEKARQVSDLAGPLHARNWSRIPAQRHSTECQ